MRIQVKASAWKAPVGDTYTQFFKCVAEKVPMRRMASVEDTLRLLDDTRTANTIIWETPDGTKTLDRGELFRIAKEALQVSAGRKTTQEASVREAQKTGLVTSYKEALKFLDTQMKKIQKDLGEETPPEQSFSLAYEALQDSMPEFCAVWDKFTLLKGLREKGWRVRADQQVQAKSPYHDKMLDLQQMIGAQVGKMEFHSLTEGMRGVLTLHYGTDDKSMNVHFWHSPSESAYEVSVEKDGEVVSTLRESNPELLDPFLESVAKDVNSRGASVNRTAANQIAPDEVDDSFPEALGPDRSEWIEMVMQVYNALRDYLRHQVQFLPVKMILWREQHNGETFEYHMRGDKASISVLIRGSTVLGEDKNRLDLECVFSHNSRSHTKLESYDLDDYDSTLDLVEEIQEYLEECLDENLTTLSEKPTTIRDVLQRAIPQGL